MLPGIKINISLTPLLSFCFISTCYFCFISDDKPAIVVTHGDLMPLSDRVRVCAYLGELLGVPPTGQIFDIPGTKYSYVSLFVGEKTLILVKNTVHLFLQRTMIRLQQQQYLICCFTASTELTAIFPPKTCSWTRFGFLSPEPILLQECLHDS